MSEPVVYSVFIGGPPENCSAAEAGQRHSSHMNLGCACVHC